ncbi:Uncharacterized conserved protein (DUF2181) [Nesidiocoris tenuis]|uniref:Uncharacterized conserved protein (DUF2181) n=1 Tax=Nesidiocoris tenuis TaxID=355587 RepID=A0ABN7AWE1_9HEMI|nr:Uncharacterized conserved protein (DUF2181) [Nesidiocoris tenuis]
MTCTGCRRVKKRFTGVTLWTVLCCVGQLCSAMSTSTETDDLVDPPPDLTNVTWAHGCNSKEQLREAIQNDTINMIEADIVLGTVKGGSNISLPIMAHPPDNTSDISLEEFLNTALEFHDVSKGIKLDFKSTQAFEASIDLLERAFQDRPLYIPIWINADIMGGPGARDRQHVDPNLFLSTCSSKFPMATISVGWTTMFGTTDDRYTPEDIDRMTEILAKNCIIQPVTFAVRAAFAANSRGVLTSLIKGSSDTTTLTIWASSRGDIVDMDELRALISDVGKDRVYLDLLPDVYESFKSATGNVLSSYRTNKLLCHLDPDIFI